MKALCIGVVGPSSIEIKGPIFREAARQASVYLGQQIVVEPLRLKKKYHGLLAVAGSLKGLGDVDVVIEIIPSLQGSQPAAKMRLVMDALIAVSRKAMLSTC